MPRHASTPRDSGRAASPPSSSPSPSPSPPHSIVVTPPIVVVTSRPHPNPHRHLPLPAFSPSILPSVIVADLHHVTHDEQFSGCDV